MKKLYAIIFLITSIHLHAQEKPTPTDVFKISGEVTVKDGITLKNMTERLLLISPTDLNTGRRYVKGLSEIQVKRAQ